MTHEATPRAFLRRREDSALPVESTVVTVFIIMLLTDRYLREDQVLLRIAARICKSQGYNLSC